MKENLSNVLAQLIKTTVKNFDFSELEFQVKSHPSYPSLHAVTGVMDHFSIPNYPLELPTNMATLNELSGAFMAELIHDGRPALFYVEKIADKSFLVQDGFHFEERLSASDFLLTWSGIAVFIEPNTEEVISAKQKSNLGTYLPHLVILCSTISFLYQQPSVLEGFNFSLALFGFWIATLLVQQENGTSSKLLDQFCSDNTSESSNCSTVLQSHGAKILGVKMSDLAGIYFGTLIIGWPILIDYRSSILAILSLASLPLVGYSLYYQQFVVKKWCQLCLAVVITLLIQSVLALDLSIYLEMLSIPIPVAAFFVGAMIIQASLWFLLVGKYKDNKAHTALQVNFNRFKRNSELFSAALRKNEYYDTRLAQEVPELVFGSKAKDAVELVVITSPYCGHCMDLHQELWKMINKSADKVRLIVRLSTQEGEQKMIDLTQNLLHTYHETDEKETFEALHQLYNGFSVDQWLLTHQRTPLVTYDQSIEVQRTWRIQHQINFTPELLVEGYSYPKQYSWADLQYFITDLYEEKLVKEN